MIIATEQFLFAAIELLMFRPIRIVMLVSAIASESVIAGMQHTTQSLAASWV